MRKDVIEHVPNQIDYFTKPIDRNLQKFRDLLYEFIDDFPLDVDDFHLDVEQEVLRR